MGQKLAECDASRTIVAFYDDAVSPAPEGTDTIALTDAQHRMLLRGQVAGRRIAVGDKNEPALLDPFPPSNDELATAARVARDQALTATDWIVARHQDENLIGGVTTLSASEFAELLKYRQDLRHITDAADWPDSALPSAPDFILSTA